MENNKESNITDGMNSIQLGVKRLADILFATVGMLFLSPLYLCIFFKIKKEGDGAVIYSQERIGKHGRPFMIYKFRTMVVDAEKDGVPQLEQHDDNRMTPFGRTLRMYHLDELPQLWNVLKGDMSFVGYRPERQYFIDKIMSINAEYRCLYITRPGITSPATVNNGYTDTMDKMLIRLEMDLDYIRTRTLWGDFKVVMATIGSLINSQKR